MNPTSGDSNQGQRLLAAIVFSDVVGFSKLAAKDEQRAFDVVRRDLGAMAEICQANGGQVLKNTGDGLLMSFGSAVAAVQCALQIQKQLFDSNLLEKPDEAVQHRIGIHLGDIIVTDSDVFGDGVNVAARLQEEAKPGAICLSRTVHDVVKGKVPMEPQYLGPRHLKNIIEPVMIWQYPPLGESAQSAAANPRMREEFAALAVPEEEGGAKGTRGFLMVFGAGLVFVIALVLIINAVKSSGSASKDIKETPANPQAKERLKELVDGVKNKSNPPETKKTESVSPAPVDNTVRDLQSDALRQYDFAGFAAYLSQSQDAGKPEIKALIDRYNQLASFRQWLEGQIGLSTDQDPIVAVRPDNSPDFRVFAGKDGAVMMMDATGTSIKTVKDFSPAQVVEVSKGLLVKGQYPPPTPGSTVQSWLQIFAEEYGLPKP